MPPIALSNRQVTTAYAIDLLRAHQIRRENVVLHEQLKTCMNDVATLRNEVKELKASTLAIANDVNDTAISNQTINSTVQRVSAATETHKSRLDLQNQELDALQRSFQGLKTDMSNVRDLCTKVQEKECTKSALLEHHLQTLQAECQKLTSVQDQNAQQIQITLENFRTALHDRANESIVPALLDQPKKSDCDARPGNTALNSVSRVSESVLILDSQGQVDSNNKAISELPVCRTTDNRRIETEPDDLDLDANAHTLSYAGHHRESPEQNDSFKMLPPSAAQATQLARIKTLRQRRFDDWDSYYGSGCQLVENLPSSFEETVVHNFVNGIFLESHKKQCQQWLDLNGWTWANVTTFGSSCSQILSNNLADEAVSRAQLSISPLGMRGRLVAADKREDSSHGKNGRKNNKTKDRQIITDKPLRRSQRLAERDSSQKKRHNEPIVEEEIKRTTQIAQSASCAGNGTTSANTQLQKTLEYSKDQLLIRKPVHELAQESQTRMTKVDSGEADKTASINQGTTEKNSSLYDGIRRRKARGTESTQPLKQLKLGPDRKAITKYDDSVPKPVSKKGQPDPQAESSDDEGFLYKDNPSKRTGLVDGEAFLDKRPTSRQTASGAANRKRKGRHGHLPLLPPPEIPILPTTDEESTR